MLSKFLFRSSRRERLQLQQEMANLIYERETMVLRFAQEKEEWERSNQQLVQENMALGQRNEMLMHECAELSQVNQSHVLEKGELARRLEEVKAAYTELERRSDAARQEISTLSRTLVESQDEREEDTRRLSDEVARLRSDLSAREAELQVQLAETQSARAYLPTVDKVSRVELQEMVAEVNAQIFELGVLLADAIEIREYEVVSPKVVQESRRALEAWLGTAMLDQLSQLRPYNNFWVEAGLHSVMAQFAEWRINSWDFDASRDRGLRVIHEAVLQNEPKAISSLWRVLARKYGAKMNKADASSTQATDALIRLLMQVLWVTRSQITDDSRDWKETIRAKAQEIVEQCRAIQKTIAEDIVSGTFEVVGRVKGAVFSDEVMEVDENDVSGHLDDRKGTRILCITHLGLKGREWVEMADKSILRKVTLSKARVFLQDAYA